MPPSSETPPPAPAAPRGRRAAGPARIRPGRPSLHMSVLWIVALAVVVIDQATKAWAVSALADERRIDVMGGALGFVLVRNPGAAFSFATGQTWIFSIVAIVVTAIVVRVSKRLGSMWWAVTLGLVLGGAVGNLIDRLVRAPGIFRGHVVDFIDYGGLFVGNIADIAIVGAAVAIVGLSLIGLEVDGSRAAEDAEGRAAARAALDGPPDRGERTAGSPETAELAGVVGPPGGVAVAEPAGPPGGVAAPEPAGPLGVAAPPEPESAGPAAAPDGVVGAGPAADCAEDPAPPPAPGRTPGSAPGAPDEPERRA